MRHIGPCLISLAHDVPGRIRFAAPPARHDRRAAASLRRLARSLPGVTAVRFNPITGSLIVHYDEADDTRGRILAALQVDGPTPAPTMVSRRKAPPAWSPEHDRLANLLAKVVARHLAERAITMAITALIRPVGTVAATAPRWPVITAPRCPTRRP